MYKIKQKSTCYLSIPFDFKKGFKIDSLKKVLTTLDFYESGSPAADKTKYYPHLLERGSLSHIPKEDIYRIEPFKQNLNAFRLLNGLKEKEVYLDAEKEIEFITESIQWYFILDKFVDYGILIYRFELLHLSDSPLETMSKSKFFRFFIDPSDSDLCRLKIFTDGQLVDKKSLYELLMASIPDMEAIIQFTENKPTQLHFFDKLAFDEANKDKACYNIFRIPGSTMNKDNFIIDYSNSIFRNDSLYVFAMNEGAIFLSPYKTYKELNADYLTAFLYVIVQRELIQHIVSLQSKGINLKNLTRKNSTQLKLLMELNHKVKITSYLSSFPISNHTEVRMVYKHLKNQLLKEDLDELETLNEITKFIQEENERERSSKESKMGFFLGVLGITGFVSFVFDYFYVSNNQKILDSLNWPMNLMPFFIFVLISVIIMLVLRLTSKK